MTRSSPARRERRRLERKGRGRPRGSSIPLARDRQRFAIAIWWALYKFGYGPYQAAHLAAVVVQNEPIRLEDVESLLIVASSKIRFTASSLEEHVAWLARKAKKARPDAWLLRSATCIQGLIIFIRDDNTAGACRCLDTLIGLGWGNVIEQLHTWISEALKSNIPPRDLKLGPAGRKLLARFRKDRPKT